MFFLRQRCLIILRVEGESLEILGSEQLKTQADMALIGKVGVVSSLMRSSQGSRRVFIHVEGGTDKWGPGCEELCVMWSADC